MSRLDYKTQELALQTSATELRPAAPAGIRLEFLGACEAFSAWQKDRQSQNITLPTNMSAHEILISKNLTSEQKRDALEDIVNLSIHAVANNIVDDKALSCEEKRVAIEHLAEIEQLPPRKKSATTYSRSIVGEELAELIDITKAISKAIGVPHSAKVESTVLELISSATHSARAIGNAAETPYQKGLFKSAVDLLTSASTSYNNFVGQEFIADPRRPALDEVVRRAPAFALKLAAA